MARILALVSICFALVGCELVADFDRAKIPVDASTQAAKDAGAADSAAPPPGAEEDAGNDEDAGR